MEIVVEPLQHILVLQSLHLVSWSLDNSNFKKIIVDYYKIFAEQDNLDTGNGWKNAFESLFGITMSQFYIDFDAFMRQSRSSQIALLKTKSEMQSASWSE